MSRPFDKSLGRKADPQGERFTIKGLREPERMYLQEQRFARFWRTYVSESGGLYSGLFDKTLGRKADP